MYLNRLIILNKDPVLHKMHILTKNHTNIHLNSKKVLREKNDYRYVNIILISNILRLIEYLDAKNRLHN